ncbi:MAG: arginine--tRNA ligase [Lachnospiraceae bacterium]|jgi:arginyl-tRNA synthetase|nr:arginine--tRNA ligase [Lachnospiraceae bacterium]
MEHILDLISSYVAEAFEIAGYDRSLGKVTVSNRPDLCEYQCNGAMAGAKLYHRPPLQIAEAVVDIIDGMDVFSKAEAVRPGFINLSLSPSFLSSYLQEMEQDDYFGVRRAEKPAKIIIDYGGANVAKPLHVGHLRSAVIGESIKRTLRYLGNDVLGDVHLGDWGLQMGLIITEVRHRHPELPYFDETFTGEYPKEAPFTISELEEIYPEATRKSKEDEAYKAEALDATYRLQQKQRGYYALWQHILNVSVKDLKRNYDSLDVTFDLWKKESDAQPYIPGMVDYLKRNGYAHVDQGALVVDVAEEGDTKKIPPCMILKSDGASLYNTTDLATIVMRREKWDPDEIIYVVDKRQELYFTQVFRCARKTKLVKDDTKLEFLGFGTMNGKDGKPFKTRQGGVMRLELLIRDINEEMYRKIMENHETEPDEARKTAQIVALSAIKYGDLSNQASKDYVFDVDKFTSFEGNTGPYILYTIVRIKSILRRYLAEMKLPAEAISRCRILPAAGEAEKALCLALTGFAPAVEEAGAQLAPHRICGYLYQLSNEFNRFYHETRILAEENEEQRKSYIAELELTRKVLEQGIDLLGFSAPDKM